MGSICSCLPIEDFEECMHSHPSVDRHCICLQCWAGRLMRVYLTLFQRGEVRAVPLSTQESTSFDSATPITDNSTFETCRSPPRPLPYDDPRCSRPQRDGLFSRRDKSSSHFHEETELLGRSSNDTNTASMSTSDKLSGYTYEGGSKLYCSNSLLKKPSMEVTSGLPYIFFPSSDDEDVCPTCLEEYTSENPRIVMKCSHHFHLGCIYEWKERSEFCPVCGKVMVFDETK